MKRKDPNQQAVELVRAVTGTKKRKGDELLASPKLRKMFAEALKKEKARKKKKGGK